jgi:hypothetical protein
MKPVITGYNYYNCLTWTKIFIYQLYLHFSHPKNNCYQRWKYVPTQNDEKINEDSQAIVINLFIEWMQKLWQVKWTGITGMRIRMCALWQFRHWDLASYLECGPSQNIAKFGDKFLKCERRECRMPFVAF